MAHLDEQAGLPRGALAALPVLLAPMVLGAAVLALRERYGGSVVLKGAGTLIADADGVAVCPYGNPGMASGGMGDVLSGVIGALLGQGRTPGEAARLGVLIHALAGDAAARAGGERGLVATDLASYVRVIANPRS